MKITNPSWAAWGSDITYHMWRAHAWVPAQALKVGMKVDDGTIVLLACLEREGVVEVRLDDGSIHKIPLHSEVRVVK